MIRIFSHQEMQIKTILGFHPTHPNGCYEKKCNGEQKEATYIIGGNCTSTPKNNKELAQITKNRITIWSSYTIPEYLSKGIKVIMQKRYMYTSVYRDTILYLMSDEWIKKNTCMCYMYTWSHKGKIMPFAGK